MKCPKCSFTSFDYLDVCKKCGGDLRDVRTLLQIIAVSPDERASTAGQQAAPTREPSPAVAYGVDTRSAFAAKQEQADDALLADLNFDESFEGMVEPTSYGPGGKKGPSPEPEGASEDDELLELDFGDVFGEKKEKDS
jgi:hypothetical protein